ncbi:1574_t:CDS:1, partial [Funneliformis geosporum]
AGVGALLITFKQYKPQATVYSQELSHESVLIAQELLTNRKEED